MTFKKLTLAGAASLLISVGAAHAADDPGPCKQVHFSDVGWSCVTATTAIATAILEGLGYEPKVDVLSVPVTFQSLANGDLDAFLTKRHRLGERSLLSESTG